MPDEVKFWQPNIVRQSSAAKGLMGARPQVHKMYPD
jgi:hypothetical protein